MHYTPYAIPYLLAAAMLLAFLPAVWRRRATRGGRAFLLLLTSSAFWSVANACEMAAVALPGKIIAANVQYFAIMSVPVLWLVFALQYTGRVRRLRPGWALLLTVVPVITVALLWTGWQRLMRYDLRLESGSPSIVLSYGPWFYFMAVYNYALLAGGAVVLLQRTLHGQSLFRSQSLLLVVACLLPLVANVAHVLSLGPLPFLDLTPPTFAVAVLILALAVHRYRMLDLVPAAREAVIEMMPDALLVIDQAGRVVDANPAAVRLLGGRASLIGQEAAWLLPADSRHLLAQPATDGAAHVVAPATGGLLLDMRVTPLGDGSVVSGWLAVFHDITERETTVRQLQAALAEVRTLSGLIPICSACKKVRDDDGYWQQVEAFVSAHSDAEFTHSLCPECAARLYPEPPDA